MTDAKTLCFDINFFGSERQADEVTCKQFDSVKKSLVSIGFEAFKEALISIRSSSGAQIWYKRRIHIKSKDSTASWADAKLAIGKTLKPHFYFVDFVTRPRVLSSKAEEPLNLQ